LLGWSDGIFGSFSDNKASYRDLLEDITTLPVELSIREYLE
jgi:hypothetical protein